MVRPAGFEPTTSRSATWRSIRAELRARKRVACYLKLPVIQAAKCGGGVRSNLELLVLLSNDLKIIAETFVKLEFSLKWIISIPNAPPEQRSLIVL